jgi:membrane associated rhomboid family serine protease
VANSSRTRFSGILYTPGFPPGVKWLLISNVAIFVLGFFAGLLQLDLGWLPLTPFEVIHRGMIWQLATYMFLHGGLGHILWNMLALWMFGREFEQLWGTRRFLRFYFFCGIGAGICVVIGNYLFGNPRVATIGSSGAIYGILLASAVLWPDRQILFYFLIPVKMKYFVAIIGAIAFLNSFNTNSPVSDVAHLGGMLFGYIFLKMPRTRGFDPLGSLKETYTNWKLARAKRKFQVYMRKKGSDRDRWVN